MLFEEFVQYLGLWDFLIFYNKKKKNRVVVKVVYDRWPSCSYPSICEHNLNFFFLFYAECWFIHEANVAMQCCCVAGVLQVLMPGNV